MASEFQYLDLIKLSQMVRHGSISRVNMAVVLGDRVPPPADFGCIQFPHGVVFVEATLLCGAFNRSIIEQFATSQEFRDTIRRGMKNVHLLEGKIAVLVPEEYVNFGLVSIFGRLSPFRESRCRFYMSQWGYDKSNGIYLPKPVSISKPTEDIYTLPYYNWLQRCSITKSYEKPIPCSGRLQITGIDRDEVEPPRIIHQNSGGSNTEVSEISKPMKSDTIFNITGSEVRNIGVGEQFNTHSSESNFSNSPIPTAHKPLVMTSDLDLFRKEIVPTTSSFESVKSVLSTCTDKLETFLRKMEANDILIEACIKMFVESLPKYWTRKPNGVGNTGRDIFFTACKRVQSSSCKDDDSENSDKVDLDNLLELYRTNSEIVEIWGKSRNEAVKGMKFFYRNRDAILYALFEVILEISCDINILAKMCRNRDIDLLGLINENPYKLCFISSAVTLEDMDKFAMVVELFNKDGEIRKYRTIAYIHFYMCDSNNAVLNSSTIIPRQVLESRMKVGYVLTSAERRRMTSAKGVFLKDKVFANIEAYFAGMKPEHCMLPTDGKWQRLDNFHEFLPMGVTNKQALDWYIESGMGVQTALSGVLSISDYTMASKEVYIYNKIQRVFKLNKDNTVDDFNLDEIVDHFEELKSKELGIENFKLEDRQREAVKMIGQPIYAVIGGAGCGKTTTAEAIVYALQEVYGYADSEIVYAAPTGKAASRLKESVKRDTRTIHSLFGIGGTSTFILNDKAGNKLKDAKVLILDECSMININIMHTVMNGVSPSIKIIMLGDIAQLPPIGFGKPFANLLSFIPCVKLNVSKRASSKSLITRNANAFLDPDGNGELVNGKDFMGIDIESSEAVNCISSLVRYHLGLESNIVYPTVDIGVLDKNDIQIVTPIRSTAYNWGSDNLNGVLQDIFNPFKSQRAIYHIDAGSANIKSEYRVGDRVIHTKNISDMNRYALINSEYKVVGQGIVNGEVGVIKRIILADEMKSFTEEEDLLRWAKYDSTVFIEVEYDNVSIDSDDDLKSYSIMYPIRCSTSVDGSYGSMNGRYITTSPITLISLAYALTVHKMQGSQAKLVIIPIFKMRRSGFISRNMVYTAITRASKGCYIVGDVNSGGTKSALAEAQKVEVTGSRYTLFEQFTTD